MEVVPDAKHAFYQEKLQFLNGGSLGVEHASDEAIIEAFKKS